MLSHSKLFNKTQSWEINLLTNSMLINCYDCELRFDCKTNKLGNKLETKKKVMRQMAISVNLNLCRFHLLIKYSTTMGAELSFVVIICSRSISLYEFILRKIRCWFNIIIHQARTRQDNTKFEVLMQISRR